MRKKVALTLIGVIDQGIQKLLHSLPTASAELIDQDIQSNLPSFGVYTINRIGSGWFDPPF